MGIGNPIISKAYFLVIELNMLDREHFHITNGNLLNIAGWELCGVYNKLCLVKKSTFFTSHLSTNLQNNIIFLFPILFFSSFYLKCIEKKSL